MKIEWTTTARAAVLLLFTMTAKAPAQSVLCRQVAAAMLKHAAAPYHMYMTRRTGAKGEQEKVSESISAGGWLYVLVNGKWIKSRMSVKDMVEEERTAADSVSRLYTCTRVGSAQVNGVLTQQYHARGKTEDGVKQEDVWLSSDGLIEQVVAYADDGSAAGQKYATIRYVYTNVQPPPGVK